MTHLTPANVVRSARKDFKVFLALTWKHLGLPSPTPVQYQIANFLQHGTNRRVVEAFRGVGKSWITSAYVCWLLWNNPNTSIEVVSASKVRADDFSTFTLRLIHEMPLLRHLIPREEQRSSKVAFDVGPASAKHAPSVKSVGITGQLTGSRADHIIADDIEVANNSMTALMRDRLAEMVKEFEAILTPNEDSSITFLGTPQTEMSLYNTLPERGYEVCVWPALVPNDEQIINYGTRLAPEIAHMSHDRRQHGLPTDPKRFNGEDLEARRLSYGNSGFALQFMLDTRLSDADRYPLKLNDLVVLEGDGKRLPMELAWGNDPTLRYDDLPLMGFNGDFYHRPFHVTKDEWHKASGSMMFIDPSGRGDDETAWAVVKHLNGMLYLTAMGGLKGGYDEIVLAKLAEVAKYHEVNLIQCESNFGGGMFSQLLKPVLREAGYAVKIEDVHNTVRKEERIIDTLEPIMNQHRLVILSGLLKSDYDSVSGYPPEQAAHYAFAYQLSRMTREKGALRHDDRLDAVAGAVAYWVESMATDHVEQAQVLRDRLWKKDIEQAQRNLVGGLLARPRKSNGSNRFWGNGRRGRRGRERGPKYPMANSL